jgi:hypothetical protein
VTITYHWGRGVMVCSFCGQPALNCNLYSTERCVERAAWDIVCSAASSSGELADGALP